MVAFPLYESRGEQRWRMHASAVCYQGAGILLLGPPASGKSSHAAAFMWHGAGLIGDDYLMIERKVDGLFASPVPEIAGVLALDGYPLLQVPYLPQAPLTHMLLLAPCAGNPLAFTGGSLPLYDKGTLQVRADADAFASAQCAHGATLPPDWMPKHAANG